MRGKRRPRPPRKGTGVGVWGKQDRGKRGTKSKDPVRRESGGHSCLADPLGHPALGASSLHLPDCQQLPFGGVGRGFQNAASSEPRFGFRFPSCPWPAPPGSAPRRGLTAGQASSHYPRVARSAVGEPGRRNESYLIAHTPTPVCGSWSPFPVICKTEKEGCVKLWITKAQGSKEAPWGAGNFNTRK